MNDRDLKWNAEPVRSLFHRTRSKQKALASQTAIGLSLSQRVVEGVGASRIPREIGMEFLGEKENRFSFL